MERWFNCKDDEAVSLGFMCYYLDHIMPEWIAASDCNFISTMSWVRQWWSLLSPKDVDGSINQSGSCDLTCHSLPIHMTAAGRSMQRAVIPSSCDRRADVGALQPSFKLSLLCNSRLRTPIYHKHLHRRILQLPSTRHQNKRALSHTHDLHTYLFLNDNQSSCSNMPVSSTRSIADSPLFRLPPELRNRIYEYAVLSPGDPMININEDNGIPEPSLLASCKTTRREAIGIFYSPSFNDVRMTIDSFHPAMVIIWARKRIVLAQQYGLKERDWGVDTAYWFAMLVEFDALAAGGTSVARQL